MNFKEWFSSNLKLKRWLFFILVGVFFIAYGMNKIIQNDNIEIADIFKYGGLIVVGAVCVVFSYIMSQKQIVQTIAEATIKSNKNINIKKLLYDKNALDIAYSIEQIIIEEFPVIKRVLDESRKVTDEKEGIRKKLKK